MNVIDRFTDYDVLAYLPQGYLVLAATDYIFGTSFVLHSDWKVSEGFLVFFAAYVAGHLVANPSSLLFERLAVGKLLMQPSEVLLSRKARSKWLRLIFSDYYRPLADGLRLAVANKLKLTEDVGGAGEEVFWKAYPIARSDEVAAKRMEKFLNLYGFCRNTSFVMALTAIALMTQCGWVFWILHRAVDPTRLVVAVVLSGLSFIMFQRYLKFLRLYTLEIFVSASR